MKTNIAIGISVVGVALATLPPALYAQGDNQVQDNEAALLGAPAQSTTTTRKQQDWKQILMEIENSIAMASVQQQLASETVEYPGLEKLIEEVGKIIVIGSTHQQSASNTNEPIQAATKVDPKVDPNADLKPAVPAMSTPEQPISENASNPEQSIGNPEKATVQTPSEAANEKMAAKDPAEETTRPNATLRLSGFIVFSCIVLLAIRRADSNPVPPAQAELVEDEVESKCIKFPTVRETSNIKKDNAA